MLKLSPSASALEARLCLMSATPDANALSQRNRDSPRWNA